MKLFLKFQSLSQFCWVILIFSHSNYSSQSLGHLEMHFRLHFGEKRLPDHSMFNIWIHLQFLWFFSLRFTLGSLSYVHPWEFLSWWHSDKVTSNSLNLIASALKCALVRRAIFLYNEGIHLRWKQNWYQSR